MPTWHGINGPLYGQKEYGRFVRSYLGCIASVEDSLGRILGALEETGQLDRTLIVFKADPLEQDNLIDDPAAQGKLKELQTELVRLMTETGALPDKMPIDGGIKAVLPRF